MVSLWCAVLRREPPASKVFNGAPLRDFIGQRRTRWYAVVAQAFTVGAAPAAAVPVVRRYGFSDVITCTMYMHM